MSLQTQLSKIQSLQYENGIFYQKKLSRPNSFEESYLKLREREGRIHSDEGLKNLPEVPLSHPKKKEWEMRKSTCYMLVDDLKKSRELKILEVGCGNGWLSNNIANSMNAEVCALDINEAELLQAQRVFSSTANICFVYADIFSNIFDTITFDAIVLDGSIQYFSDVKKLLAVLLDTLTPTGKIYIADSPIHSSPHAALAAQKRTFAYFNSLGFPEMGDHFIHHQYDVLKPLRPEMIYNPYSPMSLMKRKIFRKSLSIFPIICITK